MSRSVKAYSGTRALKRGESVRVVLGSSRKREQFVVPRPKLPFERHLVSKNGPQLVRVIGFK